METDTATYSEVGATTKLRKKLRQRPQHQEQQHNNTKEEQDIVPYFSNPWITQQTENYFSYYYQQLPHWQQLR